MSEDNRFEAIHLKAEVSERLDYVRQVAYNLDGSVDAEFLLWLKNRLSEPFRVVQQKLYPKVEEKHLPKNNK